MTPKSWHSLRKSKNCSLILLRLRVLWLHKERLLQT
nr:MAG TPA: hypothetical protein [Caudoviricetes sp.]